MRRINLLRFGVVRPFSITFTDGTKFSGIVAYSRPPEMAQREGGEVTARPIGPLKETKPRASK